MGATGYLRARSRHPQPCSCRGPAHLWQTHGQGQFLAAGSSSSGKSPQAMDRRVARDVILLTVPTRPDAGETLSKCPPWDGLQQAEQS